jgi:hypothetical protein
MRKIKSYVAINPSTVLPTLRVEVENEDKTVVQLFVSDLEIINNSTRSSNVDFVNELLVKQNLPKLSEEEIEYNKDILNENKK